MVVVSLLSRSSRPFLPVQWRCCPYWSPDLLPGLVFINFYLHFCRLSWFVLLVAVNLSNFVSVTICSLFKALHSLLCLMILVINHWCEVSSMVLLIVCSWMFLVLHSCCFAVDWNLNECLVILAQLVKSPSLHTIKIIFHCMFWWFTWTSIPRSANNVHLHFSKYLHATDYDGLNWSTCSLCTLHCRFKNHRDAKSSSRRPCKRQQTRRWISSPKILQLVLPKEDWPTLHQVPTI